MADNFKIGHINWMDLTVPNAEKVKEFYCSVVGWNSNEHVMGDYNDFEMMDDENKESVTGICHKKGVNKNIPSQWLIYINVQNVNKSISTCESLGGKLIDGPRKMGKYEFAVIQDPEGAIVGILSIK